MTVWILVNRLNSTSKNSRFPDLVGVLFLTVRAVMRTSTGNDDALDGLSTLPAGFAGPLIYAMFQLEESAHPFSVHIV